MAVAVVAADDSHLPGLVAVLVAGSREPAAERPEDLARYADALARVRAAGGEVLVAVDDGEVVGMLEVLALPHVQHAGGTAAELESVHVAASHRGRGVGRRLVEAAVAWAAARGCYRVQLTSHLERTGAHAFYERLGFAPSHVGYKLVLDPGPLSGSAAPRP